DQISGGWTKLTFTVPFQEAAVVPSAGWLAEYFKFVIGCYKLLHFVAFWSKRSRHRETAVMLTYGLSNFAAKLQRMNRNQFLIDKGKVRPAPGRYSCTMKSFGTPAASNRPDSSFTHSPSCIPRCGSDQNHVGRCGFQRVQRRTPEKPGRGHSCCEPALC